MDEISDTVITYNVSVISDMYREKQNMIKAATKAMEGHLKAFKENPGIYFYRSYAERHFNKYNDITNSLKHIKL